MKVGSFKGLVPLIIFILLYVGSGIVLGNFESIPLLVHLIITILIAILMTNKNDKKSLDEKIALFCRGAGEETVVLMIIIFILSGAFFGVAKGIHAVDAFSNLGLSLLGEKGLLPGIFVISCILSFAMGTSMGTVAAVAPLGIEMAQKSGMSVALVCGIVLGGAMFGDNLSFISDTTIAATRTQNIQMKDKFKANALMVLPAFLVNVILLLFIPVKDGALANQNLTYHWVDVLPYVLVIILSLFGAHVITVLTMGIFSGILVGVFQADFSLIPFVKTVYEGITGMEEIAVISLLIGGLVALMRYLGGIDWLLGRMTKAVKSKRQAELSIAGLVSLMDVTTANNTISILAIGPLAKDISYEFDVSPSRTASILDLFSSAFNGLLPYSPQLLIISQLAGLSPTDVMIFNWYSLLMIAFAFLSILLQYPKGNLLKKS